MTKVSVNSYIRNTECSLAIIAYLMVISNILPISATENQMCGGGVWRIILVLCPWQLLHFSDCQGCIDFTINYFKIDLAKQCYV